ncbi:PepSY-associated TM helix domain-containing protein, partial [Acinetobacter baumannii]
DSEAPLPRGVQRWLRAELGITRAGNDAEWSDAEVYLPLPRPGGDAWLSIDRADGTVTHEVTDRGWVSYFNDLHKGRHTGAAWSWFIDIFAVASLVF